MIGIIIGIITGTILFFYFKKLCKKGDTYFQKTGNNIFTAIWCGFLTFMVAELIVFIGFHAATTQTTKTSEKVGSAKIIALQDNQSLDGRFFLGSGSVNNKEYYAFYMKTKNGFKYETLDAKSSSRPVYIKYITPEETPRIDQYAVIEREIYTGNTNPLWFSIVAALAYGDNEAGDVVFEEQTSPALISSRETSDNFRYEIFIPEGSIQQNYHIDLE